MKEDEEQLSQPAYFLNKNSGDVYMTWYRDNFPVDTDWVRISKKVYELITRSLN